MENLEFKGTKGEWTYSKNSSFFEVNKRIEGDSGNSLAIQVILNECKGKDRSLNSISLSEENEANAKLIASAPDLLRELKNIINCWESDTVTDKDFEYAKQAIEKALK